MGGRRQRGPPSRHCQAPIRNTQIAGDHVPSTHVCVDVQVVQISRGDQAPAPPAVCNPTSGRICSLLLPCRSSAPRIGNSEVLPWVAVRHILSLDACKTQILFLWNAPGGFLYFWVYPESRPRRCPSSRLREGGGENYNACSLLKIHRTTWHPKIFIKHQEQSYSQGLSAPPVRASCHPMSSSLDTLHQGAQAQPASPAVANRRSRFSTVSIVSSRVPNVRPRKAYWKPGKGPASKPPPRRRAQYVLKPQRVNATTLRHLGARPDRHWDNWPDRPSAPARTRQPASPFSFSGPIEISSDL